MKKYLFLFAASIMILSCLLGKTLVTASDVNTTRKHYAAQEDQRRKSARNIVQLREKKEQGPQ